MRDLNEVAELRGRVRAMRLVFRNLPGVLVALYDRTGVCALMEGLGHAQLPGVEGQHFIKSVPPDRRDQFTRLFDRAAAGLTTKEDYPLSGGGLLLEATASPVNDERGKVLFVLFFFRDITTERAALVALEAKGGRDSLTGLAKRSVLEAHTASLLTAGTPFAVLFVDLDRFKLVNDTLGHKTGDVVLKKVTREILLAIRARDLAVRLGGDEFVVVLSDAAASKEVARRILSRVRVVTEPFGAGASMGIALFPEDGATLDEILAAADRAMYRAKKNGNGDVETPSPTSRRRTSLPPKLDTPSRRTSITPKPDTPSRRNSITPKPDSPRRNSTTTQRSRKFTRPT